MNMEPINARHRTLQNCAVFSTEILSPHDYDYLMAAAAHTDQAGANFVGERIVIRISDNAEDNLYLHGTTGTQELLREAEAKGYRYIELDPDFDPYETVNYSLPYSITMNVGWRFVGMSSLLRFQFCSFSQEGEDHSRGEGAAVAVEELVEAMARQGYDLSAPAFTQALNTAVEETTKALQSFR